MWGREARRLYARFLSENASLPNSICRSLSTFHYLQPDVDWHDAGSFFATQAMPQRPILIADAGFMYAAKMGGQSGS